ncbi:MAG: rubredoxin [Tenericutes bacterium]|nr:rubredoxin [Bacilli bacterium]MDD3995787.1 rubredoxin [Bacilli bacterium]MDD4831979.1 rubredoxin [Bacilli bacterium]NLV90112.1 rubredoxin [Mycoplasmatota bacterium]
MEDKKQIYVCSVCGYETVGPLPDDYICPVCGVDVTHFVLKEEKQ